MITQKNITVHSLLLCIALIPCSHNASMPEYFAVNTRSTEAIRKDMMTAQSELNMLSTPIALELFKKIDQLDAQAEQYIQTRKELLEKIRILRESDAPAEQIETLVENYKQHFSHHDIPAEKKKREYILQWDHTQQKKDPENRYRHLINGWQLLLNREKLLHKINILKAEYWHAQARELQKSTQQ